jgi:DNA invertase Pin-like site-specific DNA recombinase
MRVVGYARVSLDCSVADVLSRNAQFDSIAGWARAHGHRLVRTYCDDGACASSDLETRLALGDAFQAIRDHRADALAVARLDRLALSVVLQEQLLAEIEGRGAALFSAFPGEEAETTAQTRDPTRLLVRDVVRSFPAFQSALRDLWVRQRWRHVALPEERADEVRALIRSEELVEQGVGAREVSAILSSEGFDIARIRPFGALRHLFGRHPGG